MRVPHFLFLLLVQIAFYDLWRAGSHQETISQWASRQGYAHWWVPLLYAGAFALLGAHFWATGWGTR